MVWTFRCGTSVSTPYITECTPQYDNCRSQTERIHFHGSLAVWRYIVDNTHRTNSVRVTLMYDKHFWCSTSWDFCPARGFAIPHPLLLRPAINYAWRKSRSNHVLQGGSVEHGEFVTPCGRTQWVLLCNFLSIVWEEELFCLELCGTFTYLSTLMNDNGSCLGIRFILFCIFLFLAPPCISFRTVFFFFCCRAFLYLYETLVYHCVWTTTDLSYVRIMARFEHRSHPSGR